jgi:hypothetical protein
MKKLHLLYILLLLLNGCATTDRIIIDNRTGIATLDGSKVDPVEDLFMSGDTYLDYKVTIIEKDGSTVRMTFEGYVNGALKAIHEENSKNLKALPQMPDSDFVSIRGGFKDSPFPLSNVTDAGKIHEIRSFINSLPPKWNVPWYGPPVAMYNFEFHRNGEFIGRFGIGPSFFTRDEGNFYSQHATEDQMKQLSSILEVDLSNLLNQSKNGITEITKNEDN